MGASASEVREHARSKGVEVGARGQLSADVIAAFNKGKRGAKRYTRPSEANA